MVYTKPVDSVFARSDWLLKLGIFLDFSREIPLNSQKKILVLAIHWFGMYHYLPPLR